MHTSMINTADTDMMSTRSTNTDWWRSRFQLEDETYSALDEVAAELTKELKQPWDRGAVVRLA